MRTIDVVTLFAYAWTFLVLIYLIPALMRYFYGRIRAQVISLFMAVVFIILAGYAGLMGVGFWSRYISAVASTPDNLTTGREFAWSGLVILIAAGLTVLAVMLGTNRAGVFRSWGEKRRDK